MQARERAEKIAIAACKRENMQLLDATVSLKKFGIEKNEYGNRIFLRYFGFEFSDNGEQRRNGMIAMRDSIQQYLYMDLPEKSVIDISSTSFDDDSKIN